MTIQTERYAAIAAEFRKQRFPEVPVKHEWVELISRLCRDDVPHLREIGIVELNKCAERATWTRHK